MKFALKWCVVALIVSTLVAQTAATPKSNWPVARTIVTAADVQALKDALAAQQQQIDRLRREM